MVTMKDVAKLAGVSVITVSRAVNDSGYVGAATRRRVEAAIEELHYVPNRVASNLRSRQSDFLALVLPDITNSFWTSIARGVEDEAWAQGYGVFICNTDNDPVKEDGYIKRLVQQRVEGVLIVPTPYPASERQLVTLRRHNIKSVVVHRRTALTIADVVRSDGEGAARALTAELLQSGCKRIAFVALPLSDQSSQDRLQGYQGALKKAGIPSDPELVRTAKDRKETDGDRMVSDLLSDGTRPDAILLANSRLALGGLRAIARAGLKIPDDMAVAAFHDITAMDDYAPYLIRAVQPSYLMGQLATRRLLELDMAAEGPHKEIILQPKIYSWDRSAKASAQ